MNDPLLDDYFLTTNSITNSMINFILVNVNSNVNFIVDSNIDSTADSTVDSTVDSIVDSIPTASKTVDTAQTIDALLETIHSEIGDTSEQSLGRFDSMSQAFLARFSKKA